MVFVKNSETDGGAYKIIIQSRHAIPQRDGTIMRSQYGDIINLNDPIIVYTPSIVLWIYSSRQTGPREICLDRRTNTVSICTCKIDNESVSEEKWRAYREIHGGALVKSAAKID